MARNRLYIRDAATGHLLYLAKSNGPVDSDVGWWMCACTPDEFNEFMRAHQEVGPTGMPTTMELVTDVDDDNPPFEHLRETHHRLVAGPPVDFDPRCVLVLAVVPPLASSWVPVTVSWSFADFFSAFFPGQPAPEPDRPTIRITSVSVR